MISEMANLKENSPAKIDSVQITLFPGTDAEDLDDMMNSFKELGLVVHLIMMVGGADPMNPDDEEGGRDACIWIGDCQEIRSNQRILDIT